MLISFARTIILYSALIFVIRIMGKRQIGEMEPTEFVVTMLVANLAAIPMQDNGLTLLSGLVPILTVFGMEVVLSGFALKWIPFRKLLCGSPVILVSDGKIIQKNLRDTRVTLDELTEALRGQNVMDLTTVKYAILETNGQLSVFPYSKYLPARAMSADIKVPDVNLPYTIVSDGHLLSNNLKLANLTKTWLDQELKQRNCPQKDVFLLTVDETEKVYFVRKEGTQ